MQLPDVRRPLEQESVQFEPMTPAEFTTFVEKEVQRWKPVAIAAGVKPD